ncbi:Putative cytochrome C-type biogenesis protein [Klebsiella aerogenes]|nr:Putative cytochrome C-type biogenesis protein [Klebsiella aerogenes]
MNLLKYYQQYRDKWWALPLVLPALLLPVARWANTYTMLNGHMVFLYYLPLALVLSLMMFFGWAAIPGIIIGLLLTLAHGMMFEQSIGVLFHFLIPCVLCWGGYRIFVPQRQQVSHGNVRLMPHRSVLANAAPFGHFSDFVTDCRISWTSSAHNGNDRRYAI